MFKEIVNEMKFFGMQVKTYCFLKFFPKQAETMVRLSNDYNEVLELYNIQLEITFKEQDKNARLDFDLENAELLSEHLEKQLELLEEELAIKNDDLHEAQLEANEAGLRIIDLEDKVANLEQELFQLEERL